MIKGSNRIRTQVPDIDFDKYCNIYCMSNLFVNYERQYYSEAMIFR